MSKNINKLVGDGGNAQGRDMGGKGNRLCHFSGIEEEGRWQSPLSVFSFILFFLYGPELKISE